MRLAAGLGNMSIMHRYRRVITCLAYVTVAQVGYDSYNLQEAEKPRDR